MIDPFRKLSSSDPRERLEAARHLADHAQAAHVQIIEKALAVETVAWVASALRRAIQRAAPTEIRNAPADKQDLPVDQTAEIYSEALETTAKQIIHEIEPILGSLRLSAETELPNFENSDTKRGLDRMEALVAGLARLRRAASAPKIEEISLTNCIYEWIEEEAGAGPISILRAGPHECTVEADKGLICLGFTNGYATQSTQRLRLQLRTLGIRILRSIGVLPTRTSGSRSLTAASDSEATSPAPSR